MSRASVKLLRELLLGDGPFDAITLATDAALFDLAPEIARGLSHDDTMVRWNAIGALLTRFRVAKYAEDGLRLAQTDPEGMVRGIALCGIGEVLHGVTDRMLRRRIADHLLEVFDDPSMDLLFRGAAYDGILAALDVLPLDRPPASRLLNMASDVDPSKIDAFRKEFIV